MKPFHWSRYGNTGFEFDHEAHQVVILDRRGRPVWQKVQENPAQPIRWMGTDESGHPIATGDYICKTTTRDSHVIYQPFIFVQKS